MGGYDFGLEGCDFGLEFFFLQKHRFFRILRNRQSFLQFVDFVDEGIALRFKARLQSLSEGVAKDRRVSDFIGDVVVCQNVKDIWTGTLTCIWRLEMRTIPAPEAAATAALIAAFLNRDVESIIGIY